MLCENLSIALYLLEGKVPLLSEKKFKRANFGRFGDFAKFVSSPQRPMESGEIFHHEVHVKSRSEDRPGVKILV